MLEAYRYSSGKFPVSFFSFKLTGPDVFVFLQNQSTFNFKLLTNRQFHLASFLDPQGRVEFYAWALKDNDTFFLLVPPQLKVQAMARLEKFLISEDVLIEELGISECFFLLGPKAYQKNSVSCFQGIIFEEDALLSQTEQFERAPQLSLDETELWRNLNGWPDFKGTGFAPEIINNLRLYDLSLSLNKGCYPGQETVAKIASRRGAAYSPVLLETNCRIEPGEISSFDRKIGSINQVDEWQGTYYLGAKLLRDFRVEGMKFKFSSGHNEIEAKVRYYPLLSARRSDKAKELYYRASDFFKLDQLEKAEESFRAAIELDPEFSDAYESLGVMLGRQERFNEAIELMDHLSKLDPTSVLAHTNKSLYLMRLGKIEEAEKEKALATVKSFQTFGEEAKLKDKIELEKKKQEAEWLQRESMFKEVLEIDEDDSLANYGIGSIAVERGEWDIAIAHLEKVIQSDSNYSVAYLALGKAYKGAGLKDKAAVIWEKGITIAAKKGDLMPANQMQSELHNL